MALEIDDWIHNYRIEDILGEGANGRVYKAGDVAGNKVAIKEIFDTGDDNAIDEATHLADVPRHPNLAKILSVLDEKFLVMEFVDGMKLTEWNDEDPFTAESWWPFFSGLLDGVAHLHSYRLTHRDIKPDNIIVSQNRLVLVDFGAVRRATSLTWKQGTYGYVHPQDWMGQKGTAGPPWDIYSLAAVSFEMLFGSVRGPTEMTADLAGSNFRYVRELAHGLHDNPANRPQSIVNWLCRMVTSDPDIDQHRDGLRSAPSWTFDSGSVRSSIRDDTTDHGQSSGKLAATDGAEEWDTETLGSLRDRIARDFDLPAKSLGFQSPDGEPVHNQTQIGTFCHSWTGDAKLDDPRASVPKVRFQTKNVNDLKWKVEDVYGLSHGSVVVLKPNGDHYASQTYVRTVRRDHEFTN